MEGISTLLLLVIIVGGLLLSVLWIILPFAVFGIKGKMDGMNHRIDMVITRLNKIIELLTRIKVTETALLEQGRCSAPDSGDKPQAQ
ncbi:MAG: hypothetical protein GF417_06365 [Candidatus Latescibacteria bacterium]|nr:hypothetical protein [bacterium]MBD3424042.1 hypothetical protein [Candidatus Latescibacterota bacterium]